MQPGPTPTHQSRVRTTCPVRQFSCSKKSTQNRDRWGKTPVLLNNRRQLRQSAPITWALPAVLTLMPTCILSCQTSPTPSAPTPPLAPTSTSVIGPISAIPQADFAVVEHDGSVAIQLVPANPQAPGLWWPSEEPVVRAEDEAPTSATSFFASSSDNNPPSLSWHGPTTPLHTNTWDEINHQSADTIAAQILGQPAWFTTFQVNPDNPPNMIELDTTAITLIPEQTFEHTSAARSTPPSPDRITPADRWRMLLIDPDAPPVGTVPSSPLDRQRAAKWRTALARIAEHDQPLADRLFAHLTATAPLLPNSDPLPAWTPDEQSLRALLRSILFAPSPRSAASLAGSYLDTQPAIIARVVSDTPPILALTNIAAAPVEVVTRISDADVGELHAIDAASTLLIDAREASAWLVEAGNSSTLLQRIGPIPVRDRFPTVRVLNAPTTLASWRAGIAAAVPPQLTPVWRFYRTGPTSISMFIESPAPLVTLEPTFTLRINEHTLTINHLGVITDGSNTNRTQLAEGREQSDTSLALLFDLPAGLASATSLRVALDVHTSRGIRIGSWPRPAIASDPTPPQARAEFIRSP